MRPREIPMDAACPNPEQLREAALGLADAVRLDEVLLHVEVCAECQRQLELLDGSTDHLIERLRTLPMSARVEAQQDQVLVQAVLAGFSQSPHGQSRIAAD